MDYPFFCPGCGSLFVTCDNEMTVYLNGIQQEQTTGMKNWETVSQVTIPAGTQVLALACKNKGANFGIIASAPKATPGGLVTNSTWQCADHPVDGWTQPGFDPPAGYFSPPKLIGLNGVEPWRYR